MPVGSSARKGLSCGVIRVQGANKILLFERVPNTRETLFARK